MPSGRITPSQSSHKMRPARPVVQLADRAFVRVVGVIFVLVAMATWYQVKQWQDESVTRGRQIDALAQALVSEQRNVTNNGDTPVAPPPSQIVKNPDVIIGKDGLNGANGINGRDGKDGVDGAPGSPGPSGSPGSPGPTGPPGEEGSPGGDGATVVGPSGAQGERGEKGDTGDRGAQGPAPSGWTFTYGGVAYTCKPVTEGSDSYSCEAAPPAESGTSPSDTTPAPPLSLQSVLLPAAALMTSPRRAQRLRSVTGL
jgi:hypothetical protein